MNISKAKSVARRIKGLASQGGSQIKRVLGKDSDFFLRRARGVIHVGANDGQERGIYAEHGLNVLWVEPIPEVFLQLQANLRGLPRQKAVQCLVTNKDNVEYIFHVANNNGASSSILPLAQHGDIWPEVAFEKEILLSSLTLPSLLKRENLEADNYDTLVLDTQGSELLILQGAVEILSGIRYVKVEVPDFESYKDCCQVVDIEAFLGQHGFQEVHRQQFAAREEGGYYFDILYEKATRKAA